MTEFQEFVLKSLEQIPELQIAIPQTVFQFLKDFISLIDCFIVYKDFVPVLSASITLGFISLNISLIDFIKEFKGK